MTDYVYVVQIISNVNTLNVTGKNSKADYMTNSTNIDQIGGVYRNLNDAKRAAKIAIKALKRDYNTCQNKILNTLNLTITQNLLGTEYYLDCQDNVTRTKELGTTIIRYTAAAWSDHLGEVVITKQKIK